MGRRTPRLILSIVIILMMVGIPSVAPVLADCGGGTSACSI
jgi:hypothetical protein